MTQPTSQAPYSMSMTNSKPESTTTRGPSVLITPDNSMDMDETEPTSEPPLPASKPSAPRIGGSSAVEQQKPQAPKIGGQAPKIGASAPKIGVSPQQQPATAQPTPHATSPGPDPKAKSPAPTIVGVQRRQDSLEEPRLGFGRRGSGGSRSPNTPETPSGGTDTPPPGAAGSQRRPSLIIVDANKLRPGEVAEQRRGSRRGSFIEPEKGARRTSSTIDRVDLPNTPLRPTGKAAVIANFQDNVSGIEQQTAYITFDVEGDPIPTLKFFKGSAEIFEGGRYKICTDGDSNTVHFAIRKAKANDEGKYKVVATNEHGEDTATIQLFISGKYLLTRTWCCSCCVVT